MLNQARRVLFGVVTAALVVGAIGAVFYAGRQSVDTNEPAVKALPPDQAFDYQILNQVKQLLDRNYVKQKDLDNEALFDAAINGMLGSLNDKGTYYVTADEFKNDTPISGFFDGIGATVSQQKDEVIIVAAIKGTPAEKAGLRAGDTITSVDGESAQGWTTQKVVSRIRGQRGTTVSVGIRHSDGVEEVYKLVRAPVPVDSVSTTPPGGTLKDSSGNVVNNVGYVNIREFSGRTPQEMEAALKDVIDKGAKGIILDLRYNPGGLLNSVTSVSDMFLDGGTIVVEREANGRETKVEANKGQSAGGLPVVILQNKYSASASEVLAAALSENGRATIVGEKSYGKGTVNTSKQLPNGGVLFVSIAYWLTPKGSLIDNKGVAPDIEVPLTDADIDARRDPQILRAVDVIRGMIK
jgi:carboxyl-terminal processing protease